MDDDLIIDDFTQATNALKELAEKGDKAAKKALQNGGQSDN